MRYYGVPREGVAAGTLVQKGLCTETAASAIMRQSVHMKRRGCVLRYHFSSWLSTSGNNKPWI